MSPLPTYLPPTLYIIRSGTPARRLIVGGAYINSKGVAKKMWAVPSGAQMRNELNENKYLPSNFIYLENL